MNKLGIYVHIPFCKQKCYYCDFVSFSKNEDKVERYIETLKTEIREESKKIDKENYIIDTIYIGGGTPSYIEGRYINEIVYEIRQNYNIEKVHECKIENTIKNIESNYKIILPFIFDFY